MHMMNVLLKDGQKSQNKGTDKRTAFIDPADSQVYKIRIYEAIHNQRFVGIELFDASYKKILSVGRRQH